ncbi:MAG: hypothetical protein HOJ62_01685 [Planctomycetaceae bacterium]|nr:hypothetical protein [Planctomycetaceae bacterium]
MRKSLSVGTFLFLIYIGLTLFQRGKDSNLVKFRTAGFSSVALKQTVDLVGVINKLHLDNIPHEDNAAVGLYASGLLPEYYSDSDSFHVKAFTSLGIHIKAEPKSPIPDSLKVKDESAFKRVNKHGYWFQDRNDEYEFIESLEKLPPDDLRIRRIFDDHNESINEYLALISRNQHTDYFNSSLHRSSLPLISLHRFYFKVLKLRIRLALSESRIIDAIRDCHAIHRLLCMLIDDVTTVHSTFALSNLPQVMSLWCKILSHSSTTADDLKLIQQLLSTLPRYSGIKALDIYERLSALEYLRLAEQYGGIQAGIYDTNWAGYLVLGGISFVDWDGIRERVNQLIDNCIDILEIQDHNKRRKAIRSLKTRIVKEQFLRKGPDYPTPLNIHEFSTALVSSIVENRFLQYSISTTRRVVKHSIEDLAILHTCIAIKQFQLDHERYPTSLEELLDKYISDIPYDFNAGTSVSYISAKKGALLYTVGRNQRDDLGWGDGMTFLIGEDHRGLQETSR